MSQIISRCFCAGFVIATILSPMAYGQLSEDDLREIDGIVDEARRAKEHRGERLPQNSNKKEPLEGWVIPVGILFCGYLVYEYVIKPLRKKAEENKPYSTQTSWSTQEFMGMNEKERFYATFGHHPKKKIDEMWKKEQQAQENPGQHAFEGDDPPFA